MAATALLAVLAAVVTFVATDRTHTRSTGPGASRPARFDYRLAVPVPARVAGQYDGLNREGWLRVTPEGAVATFDTNHVWFPAARYNVGKVPKGANATVAAAITVARNLEVENPYTYFAEIRSTGTPLVAEGRDVVRGKPTTRYRVSTQAIPDFEFDLWVDADSHIRRIEQSRLGVDVSRVEFFDFGAVMEHHPPRGHATAQGARSRLA
jgi:hypothetical protein